VYCFFQAGKGGELTHDETTIIAGALELSEKMVKDAMTPISDIFVIDINAKLDRFCVVIPWRPNLSETHLPGVFILLMLNTFLFFVPLV
jgi:hypothetical protein